MRISDTDLTPLQYSQLEQQMVRVLKELESISEAQQFWKAFFTPTEQVVLAKRLAIAVLLTKGRSYEEIKKELSVSSATISFVSEHLNKKGVQLALRKITEDEWAEKLLQKFHL